MRQWLDGGRLQWEYWWLCYGCLLQRGNVSWPRGLLFLRVPSGQNWYDHLHSLFLGFSHCPQSPISHILLSLQVCSVIWMMLVSVTPVMREQCVTPTLWTAVPSAPALLALLVEPATKTWMNVPLVNLLHCECLPLSLSLSVESKY